MKERPIIFSGNMVRAILNGQKTQTRRPVKPIPAYPDAFDGLRREIHGDQAHFWVSGAELPAHIFRCPFGQPGDILCSESISEAAQEEEEQCLKN